MDKSILILLPLNVVNKNTLIIFTIANKKYNII